jgi:hypothetical protein
MKLLLGGINGVWMEDEARVPQLLVMEIPSKLDVGAGDYHWLA